MSFSHSGCPLPSCNNGRKGPAVRRGNKRGRERKERFWLSMWLEQITCTALPVPTPVTKETTGLGTNGKDGRERGKCVTFPEHKFKQRFLTSCDLILFFVVRSRGSIGLALKQLKSFNLKIIKLFWWNHDVWWVNIKENTHKATVFTLLIVKTATILHLEEILTLNLTLLLWGPDGSSGNLPEVPCWACCETKSLHPICA